MSEKDLEFKYSSDQSLIVYLGDSIDLERHHRLLKLLRLLENEPLPGVRNLHPAYCSRLIVFDHLVQDHETIQGMVRRLFKKLDTHPLSHGRRERMDR